MRGDHIARIRYHYGAGGPNYEVNMHINLARFRRQYNRAQYLLDSQVMTHMVPFMPMVTHTFINVTRGMSASIAGSGKVVAAAPPFGRFLYEGKVMVDAETGSPYARRGAKKVPVSQYSGRTAARENLDYGKSKHPDATDHWFDAAKRKHGRAWVAAARKMAGGGRHR